jgi:hypothetical protein
MCGANAAGAGGPSDLKSEALENKLEIGCGGLQPSELFSYPVQSSTSPSRRLIARLAQTLAVTLSEECQLSCSSRVR